MQLKYDSNGNLISQATGGQTLYYSYDTNNRLVKVKSEQNGNRRVIVHYRYDPLIKDR